MTILQAIFLGILQGITEFLPISSDGHLVLAETYLNLSIPIEDLLGFDVLLHAGSALALLIVYRRRWWRLSTAWVKPGERRHRRLVFLLILATIPGALAGLLLSDFIISLRNPLVVGVSFLVMSLLLLAAHKKKGQDTLFSIKVWQALAMGLVQALALGPGLSRSGLTITAGQLNGIARRDALDFSFLMALPIILGAVGLTTIQIANGAASLPPAAPAAAGFITSLIVSWLAVTWLRRFVATRSLALFAWYLAPVGVLVILNSL